MFPLASSRLHVSEALLLRVIADPAFLMPKVGTWAQLREEKGW